MNKIKIAILFGGCSEEHDVSVKSAQEIAKHIDKEKYEPVYIGITRSGSWMLCESPCPEWETGECHPAVISPDRTIHGVLSMQNNTWLPIHIDVVFPVLHGRFGEDGAIQGLLELSGIPYIGCDIAGSALCMDKSLTYLLASHAGIAVPAFQILHPDDTPEINISSYPVFVKPARSGSSFGVSKVANQDELDTAIRTALAYDNKVLIEEAIPGIETGCAVLGNGAFLTTGEIDSITLSHGFFRIHQEDNPESGSENASFTVPANLPPKKQAELKETAKKAYRALGLKGLARIDMFLKEDGSIVLNEINTLPGFTSYSRYPRMMKAAGITIPQIIDRLVMLAERK